MVRKTVCLINSLSLVWVDVSLDSNISSTLICVSQNNSLLKVDGKYHFTYKLTLELTGEFYIGVHTTTNLEDEYMGSGSWTYGKERELVKEILEFYPTREKALIEEAKLIHHNYYDPLNKNSSRPYKSKVEESMSAEDKARYDAKWMEQIEIKRLEQEKAKLNCPIRREKRLKKEQRAIAHKERQRIKAIQKTEEEKNNKFLNDFLSNNINQWSTNLMGVFGIILKDIHETPFHYVSTNNPQKVMKEMLIGKPPSTSQVLKDLFADFKDKGVLDKITLKFEYVVKYDTYTTERIPYTFLEDKDEDAFNNNFSHNFGHRREIILNKINDSIEIYLNKFGRMK